MILIIDRATWLRGEGSQASYLLRPSDGKKCCLGFYAEAKGFSKEDIHMVRAPIGIAGRNRIEGEKLSKVMPGIVGLNASGRWDCTSTCGDLMRLNDCDNSPSEHYREEQIQRGFELVGVQVFFSDFPQKSAQLMREEFAYYAWQNAGSPAGRDLEFWHAAEEHIKAP